MDKDDDRNPDVWVTRFGQYLYRYALQHVKDVTQAEDLVQETLLSGVRGIGGFSGKSTVKTWLTSILKHKVIDHYRRVTKENSHSIHENSDASDDFFQNDGHWQSNLSHWQSNPQDATEQKQFMKQFQKCMDHLPVVQASVFKLRELEGLAAEEICKELDISASNLWVLIHRARTRLRGCIESNWFAKQDETRQKGFK